MSSHYTLDISTATLLRVVFIGTMIALFLVLWQFWAMLFLAVIIACSIEPIIARGERRGIPRFASVPAIYLTGLACLAGIVIFVAPTLFFELRNISATLPLRYYEFVQSANQFVGFELFPSLSRQNFPDLFEAFTGQFGLVASDIFTFAMTFLGGIFSFFLTFVISFYLAMHEKAVEKFLGAITPSEHQGYVLDIWGRIKRKLSRWMGAQLILVLFIGTTLFPLLWAFGVQYALTLAVIAGMLEVIPVIGPVTAGTIIFISALFQSPALAFLSVIVYTALEQVQQTFIVPTVVSRAIGLSPVLIVLFIAVGATLVGFWGALLAIPAGIVITEIITDIKKK